LGWLIFSILVTLDGFINHEVMIADEAVHEYSTRELKNSRALLLGRNTYQLFADSWPPVKTDPSFPQYMVDFANRIDEIEKVVFSRTLGQVTWRNSRLVTEIDPEEIRLMKAEGDLGVSGAGLANSLMKLDLIDRYTLLVNPIILGQGVPLFREGFPRRDLKLIGTHRFDSGVVVLDYERTR
jgi:dihydrofolate reductase